MSIFKFKGKQSNQNVLIKEIQQNPKYKKNEKQIEIITELLTNHADIPIDIIEMLIKSVQENVAIEYEISKYVS